MKKKFSSLDENPSSSHSILQPTLLTAAALVVLIILKMASSVAGPILFFLFLAVLVTPLFNVLKRRGLSAGLSLVIMLVAITGVFVALGWLVLSSFSQMLEGLSTYNVDFQANIQGVLQKLESISVDPTVIETINQTRFLNQALGMLLKRHKATPYAALTTSGRLPAGFTREGIVEVAAPVDYISWTEQVANFAHREDLARNPHRILLPPAAGVSPVAQAGLKSAGWEILGGPKTPPTAPNTTE